MRFRRHQQAAQASTRRLLALFALVLLGLTLAVNAALALAWRLSAPWSSDYPDWFFATNTALLLLYVLGGTAVETLRLREGGAHVARLAGGREAGRDDRLERRLTEVVAEMALAANTRAPAAWVLPREDAINAFAAGWSADDAVVAVTRGALERLDRAELQGVVAHELSHLVHGDTTLNMRLIGMVWGLRLLFDLGRRLTEAGSGGRHRFGVPFGVALMAAGALGWAAGRLLQAAVSRQREFLADASAVKYTRQVAGLGGALRKIAGQQHAQAAALSARTGPLAHLFLVSHARWAWWATHPPLAERIRRLYGRPMPGLAADSSPPPAATAPPALAALAPMPAPGPRAAASRPPPGPPPSAAPAGPARPAAAEAEAEALARIARWHGPGELHAALLTLLQPATAAPDPAAWQALPVARASAMQADLAALAPTARLAVLDTLAHRLRQTPAATRQALRAPARAATRDPATALPGLLLRQRLRARPLPFTPPTARNTLAARQAEALRATRWLTTALAACPGVGAARAAAWAARAAPALASTAGARAAPAAAPPPARAPAASALRAALRLQRLAAIERPLPLRAWVQAWADDPALAASDDAAAVLAAAALLLEVPLPPALARRLPGLDA
jgi:Zn-dependent protease with chaperone function